MKKINKLMNFAFIIAICLLGGCAEQGNSYTPGSELGSSLTSTADDVSDISSESSSLGNSSKSTSSTDISVSPSGTESSEEQSSDVSAVPIPVEFSNEDRELQEILRNMEGIYDTVDFWFRHDEPDDDTAKKYLFVFPEFKRSSYTDFMPMTYYYEIPNGYSENGMVIPQTYNDFKNLLLSFLSEQYLEATDQVIKGSMTEITGDSFTELDDQTSGRLSSMIENCDGAFFVTWEKCWDSPVKFIGIDGKMYRHAFNWDRGIEGTWIVDVDTAKVISKTDDTIEFSYITDSWLQVDKNGSIVDKDEILNDTELYEKNAIVGVLKYERGGWKRDWDKADKERWEESLKY